MLFNTLSLPPLLIFDTYIIIEKNSLEKERERMKQY